MVKICKNCGNKNDEDAVYCEGCGQPFRKYIQRKKVVKRAEDGMNNNVKALIVIIVVLIGVLGVTAGMLIQKPSEVILTSPTNTSIQQTSSQPYQPTWHKVATFTGSSDDYRTFSIRGDKFKVTMSAVPSITYSENSLLANVFAENGYMVGTGTITWGSTESPNKKDYVIPISEGEGTYSISIYAYDLESWTLTIWDFY